MNVDGSLVSLIQGVSQQPARVRLPGQCELQENMSSNPVTSLTRRPPTRFVSDLMTSDADWKFTEFTATTGDTFIVAASAGAIRVFGTDGTEYTVDAVDGLSYLTGSRVSIEQTPHGAFLADSGVTVQMLPDLPEYHTTGSIVFLLGGQYGRTYRVTCAYTKTDGTTGTVTATHSTPTGDNSEHVDKIATEYIMEALLTALVATGTTVFSFTRKSDVLLVNRIDGVDAAFSVTVDDGDGGANIFVVNGEAGDVGRLPRYAPHKYIVKITGTGSADADDWYLQFLVGDDPDTVDTGEGFGSDGIWRECTAPDQEYKLDPSTMPHLLDFVDGAFIFEEADWAVRQAGDNNSNPPVSLVGRTINSLCTFQSRLAMASGPAIVMSRTDNPTNLWHRSATVLVDDDPIDVESTAKTYSDIMTLTPFNRDLVAFSPDAQFVVFGRNALTPKNSALVLTCSFEVELSAIPQAAGRNIFFAINSGRYTGIREFYADGSQDVNDSRTITQHVQEYMVGKATLLACASNFDTLLVLCDGSPDTVFVYEYLWVDNQRAQSAWSKWTLPDTIRYFTFEEDTVHFVLSDGDRYYISSMDLDTHPDTGMTYQVKLDNRCVLSDVGTSASLPYASTGRSLVAVQGSGCPYPGLPVVFSADGADIVFNTDMGGGEVYIGERYTSRYKPTMPQVRDKNNIKIGTGKLNIRRFMVQFANAGYFKCIVRTDYSDPVELEFSGRVLGAPTNRIGEAAISDGHFDIPYRHLSDAGSIEITTDSHLPVTLLDIEWLGQFTKRGRRMA